MSYGSSGLFGEIGEWWRGLQEQFNPDVNLAERQHQLSMEYQEETWRREDTALQRMVADAKAAGINPTMLAGKGGAPTSAPMRPTGTSGQGKTPGAAVAQIYNMMKMKTDISQIKAQTAMTKAQAEKITAEADLIKDTSQSRVISARIQAEVDQNRHWAMSALQKFTFVDRDGNRKWAQQTGYMAEAQQRVYDNWISDLDAEQRTIANEFYKEFKEEIQGQAGLNPHMVDVLAKFATKSMLEKQDKTWWVKFGLQMLKGAIGTIGLPLPQ